VERHPLPVQGGATPELAQDLPAIAYLTMPRCRSARYWELRPTGLGRSPRGVGTARETLLHTRASLLRLGDETLSRLGRREAPASLSASSPAMRARFVFGGGILEARYDYGIDCGLCDVSRYAWWSNATFMFVDTLDEFCNVGEQRGATGRPGIGGRAARSVQTRARRGTATVRRLRRRPGQDHAGCAGTR
jgi:hypothetical protein